MLLVLLGSSFIQNARGATVSAAARPNIIFIVVDALRADHLSSYGYGRMTSPHVDSLLAGQGVRFSDVSAASAWTNPSNGAMLIGRLPSEVDTVWADPQRRIPATEMLLAEYLADAGYQTAGFVSNWWMDERFGYAQGFETYVRTTGSEEERERASTLNALAKDWLETQSSQGPSDERPLFLFLYYYDPHSWYDPPAPYDTLYDPDYTGTLTAEVFQHGQDVVSGDITPSARDIEHLLALYDGEITYWDHELGQMAAYLDSLGLWQDSLIILTSDHGQMFGEHGKWVHRNSLYEEVLRVPLLMRYPGVLGAGQEVNAPVSNMDILPTVLELLDIDLPTTLQGQSLIPLLQGAAPESRKIFAELAGETDPQGDAYWIAPHTYLYSVKQDGWKYTHAQQMPQVDMLVQLGQTSVYEGSNMLAEEPEKAKQLWASLQQQFAIPTQFLFMPTVERP